MATYNAVTDGNDRMRGTWPANLWNLTNADGDRIHGPRLVDFAGALRKGAGAIQLHNAGNDYYGNPRRVTTLHIAGYGMVAAVDDGYSGEPTMTRGGYERAHDGWRVVVVVLPAASCSVGEYRDMVGTMWIWHPTYGAIMHRRGWWNTVNAEGRERVDALPSYSVNVGAVAKADRERYRQGTWTRSARGVWTFARK